MKTQLMRALDNLGRVVIPADLRKQLGVMPGDILAFVLHEDGITLKKTPYNESNNPLCPHCGLPRNREA